MASKSPAPASPSATLAEAMSAALEAMAVTVGAELERIGGVLLSAMAPVAWGVRPERGDPTGDPPL